MGNFKNKLIRFMYGRYGTDTLYLVLIVLCAILLFINFFVHSILLMFLETALLLFASFRTFSRNIYQRQRENAICVKILHKIKNAFRLFGNRIRECRTHIYRKCPSCKAQLRLSRKNGKHTVRCPRCQNTFDIQVILW